MGLRRAVVWLGLAEHDDQLVGYDGYHGDEELADSELPAGNAAPGADMRIATVRPENFRDALLIGQYYRADIPVIVSLDQLDMPDAKRIVDFMSGLVFGRRGDIERLSSRVFLIVPTAFTILKDQQTLADKQFYNRA